MLRKFRPFKRYLIKKLVIKGRLKKTTEKRDFKNNKCIIHRILSKI